MASIDLLDRTPVVIIGSGAGGGTLAHELTRRGIKVVLLEAGKRQSLEAFSQVPSEAFGQLTWLDARTQSGTWGVARDFPNLPVWHCKTVGCTTVHSTGAVFAFSKAFACRAAKSARSGARSTRKFPAPKPPAISTCASNLLPFESNTETPGE